MENSSFYISKTYLKYMVYLRLFTPDGDVKSTFDLPGMGRWVCLVNWRCCVDWINYLKILQ